MGVGRGKPGGWWCPVIQRSFFSGMLGDKKHQCPYRGPGARAQVPGWGVEAAAGGEEPVQGGIIDRTHFGKHLSWAQC